jgi:D-tagatose-1,6-bisphosphate aldolase subunit GatZ/KbaZ
MREDPKHWDKYYHGSPAEQHLQRHFSYSDRIRYYWPERRIAAGVQTLLSLFGDTEIPETMVSQYLQGLYPRLRDGAVQPTAKGLVIGAIDAVLEDYFEACRA